MKVVDGWGIDEPRTKQAVEVLEALGLRAAVERARACSSCSTAREHAVWKSFRNLGERVQIVLPEELNAYDVLVNDWLVFSQGDLDADRRALRRPTADRRPVDRCEATAASRRRPSRGRSGGAA